MAGGCEAGVEAAQGTAARAPVGDGPAGQTAGQGAVRAVDDDVDVVTSGNEQAESLLYQGRAGAGPDQGLIQTEAAAPAPGQDDAGKGGPTQP